MNDALRKRDNIVDINVEMKSSLESPGRNTGNAGDDKKISIFRNPKIPARIKDDKYASAAWHWIIENLKDAGAMMRIYRDALMLHCINWSHLMSALDDLEKRKKQIEADGEGDEENKFKEGETDKIQVSPNGYKQMSSELIIYNKLLKVVKEGFAEFGMTPTAINKIGDPGQLGLPFNN